MSKKSMKTYGRSVYMSYVMVLQFGINMIVPIVMGALMGFWLDDWLDTSFMIIIFFFLGALAGARNIYRLAKNIYEFSEEESKNINKEKNK